MGQGRTGDRSKRGHPRDAVLQYHICCVSPCRSVCSVSQTPATPGTLCVSG